MPKLEEQHCGECERLARAFQVAWRSDQENVRLQFHETARSAGRDPEAFLQRWLLSLAQLPEDEFEALQDARYPRVADVRRKWKEHATLSGHSCLGDGWRSAFIFDVIVRSGYALLSGSGDAP